MIGILFKRNIGGVMRAEFEAAITTLGYIAVIGSWEDSAGVPTMQGY